MPIVDRTASRTATTGIIRQGYVGADRESPTCEILEQLADEGAQAALFEQVKLVIDARYLVTPLVAGRPLPFRLVKA
jgi:hypothetical protein